MSSPGRFQLQIPGPFDGNGSNWANIKAAGAMLDSNLKGEDGLKYAGNIALKAVNYGVNKIIQFYTKIRMPTPIESMNPDYHRMVTSP